MGGPHGQRDADDLRAVQHASDAGGLRAGVLLELKKHGQAEYRLTVPPDVPFSPAGSGFSLKSLVSASCPVSRPLFLHRGFVVALGSPAATELIQILRRG